MGSLGGAGLAARAELTHSHVDRWSWPASPPEILNHLTWGLSASWNLLLV